eukprot:gene9356-10343_t
MIRSRVKWMFMLGCLFTFGIFTFRYDYLAIEKSKTSWKLFLGSMYSISFRRVAENNATSADSEDIGGKFANVGPVKILFWSEAYRNIDSRFLESTLFPSYGKPRFSCPVSYEFVKKRSEIEHASAVVIHIKEPNNIPADHGNTSLILHYDEPPVKHSKLRNDAFMKKFRYSIGYRMDSDFPNPRISRPNPSSSATGYLDFNQKHDYVAAVFSHCNKVRTEYARELSKYLRIKSFGECLRNIEKNNIARVHETDYIASKLRRISMFKFTLVLMKYDCLDYIDEQLNHAWSAGTLPVFLGTDSLEDILPSYLRFSYISVSDFRRPIDLADYLESLTSDREYYEHYMAWRKRSSTLAGVPGNDNGNQLWKIWQPDYSPGCQIAMRLVKDQQQQQPLKKTLKAFVCKQRSIDHWFDKKEGTGKIIND